MLNQFKIKIVFWAETQNPSPKPLPRAARAGPSRTRSPPPNPSRWIKIQQPAPHHLSLHRTRSRPLDLDQTAIASPLLSLAVAWACACVVFSAAFFSSAPPRTAAMAARARARQQARLQPPRLPRVVAHDPRPSPPHPHSFPLFLRACATIPRNRRRTSSTSPRRSKAPRRL